MIPTPRPAAAPAQPVDHEPTPQLTVAAMPLAAGTFANEMGEVGRCRLQRSLDPRHGLDQEAIKAAAQWRFIPGTRQGAPVPVFVTIELAFSVQ